MTTQLYRENYANIEWAPLKSVPKTRKPQPQGKTIYVVSDIEPYRSPITDEVIGGRRQHRDHMRAHGVIERGNERINPSKPEPMPNARQDVAAAIEMVKSGYRPPRPDTYRE